MIPQYTETKSYVIGMWALFVSAFYLCMMRERSWIRLNKFLDKGGFEIKHWIISGEDFRVIERRNLNYADQEKVLGLVWSLVSD